MVNPFTPAPGRTPPVVVGRQAFADAVERALTNVNAPQRNLIVTGTRGIGKTVALRQAERLARERGWAAIGVSASTTLPEDALDELLAETDKFDNSPRMRISKLSIAVMGVGVEMARAGEVLGWHTRWRHALDALKEAGVGLLLTIDEMQPGNEALKPFFTFLAKLGDEGHDIVVVMAGLPENLRALRDRESADGITFVQRARLLELTYLDAKDVRDALLVPVRENGKTFDVDALELAVHESGGFPYLVQLIGYHSWERSDLEGMSALTRDHVAASVAESAALLADDVLAVMLRNASAVEMRFLRAMAVDDGPSRVADLVRRLGESDRYISVYRRRLVDAGLIEPVARGVVDLAVPGLRAYLRGSQG